jgi:chromosome segregation ATPase
MTVAAALAFIISIISLFVNAGAIRFFVRYGTRLEIVERDMNDYKAKTDKHSGELITAMQQIVTLNSAVAEIRSSVNSINSHDEAKMRTIDSIRVAVELLKERLEDSRKESGEMKADIRELLKRANSN